MQEEKAHNVEPPTMTTTTQFQASHCMIMEGLVDPQTEAEEDTPQFCRKLQRVLDLRFIAAATKKDRNLRPLKTS